MRPFQELVAEAFALHTAGKLEQAEIAYDQLMCQMVEPDVNVLYGYGSLLVGKQRYGLGITLLQTARQMYPKHPMMLCNLAVAYKYIGRDELAFETYMAAYDLAPQMSEVLAGLGGYYINRGEPEKAEYYSREALKHGEIHGAHMNLGVALLEQGRFDEAWPHYEHRWESLDKIGDKRPYKATRWSGEYVDVLAIHGEQGLGDEILFMSLFAKAKERVGSIVIECAGRLIPVFQESFGVPCYPDHASLIAAEGEPDAYISMGSLPMVLGLPDGKPFLKRQHFVGTGKPTIGIAWRGGTARTNSRDRSLHLSDLKPILESIDANFVSVQYGGDDIDREAIENGVIPGERGFDPLNHRISSCDLIISVCQTAVHVSGAMGIETWVLTPKRSAWRYRGHDMRPWYNSVRLFRQDDTETWGPVIAAVADELRERYAALAA